MGWELFSGEGTKGVQERALEDVFLMLGKEGHANGNLEQAMPQVGGNAFVVQDPLAVFLGGGHHGGGPVTGSLSDGGNVVPRVFVMVQEGEPPHNVVFVT